MILRLEKQQYESLLQRNERAFVDSILKEVRSMQPENRLPDDTLRHDIRVGIGRARAHGFRTDKIISEYVMIMFTTAPNFDRQPDIAKVLADRAMPEDERWERLFAPDMDRAWNATDNPKFYDARFWWPDGYDFGDHAPSPEQLTDRDWGELAWTLRYMKENPDATRVPEPSREQVDAATAAFHSAVARSRR